ncbi:MAG: tripartite tricarboxylate transporter substrate binding protein [Xanthobacteraceae bacterium]
MARRRFLAIALAAAGVFLLPPGLLAQDRYPARPIRLVVASAPGGVHDVIGRLWANRLKAALGTIVIDNRGGAGGTLGVGEVARAQPDGYTLLLGSNSTHILHPLIAKQPIYDAIRDFEVASIFAVTASSVAVHPAAPAQTLQELIAHAKANPGKLSYAYAGVGSVSHVASEMFKQLAGGLDIFPVPYKGMGPAQADVISGNVSVFLPNITGQVIELHRTGKIRILAVNAPARHPALAEIPTAVEAGVAGMIVQNFFGVFGPAGTPKAIIDRLSDATQAALDDKDFGATLSRAGFEAMNGFDPDKAKTFIRDEYVRWEAVVKAAGIKE